MLVVTRKNGESVIIGDNICVLLKKQPLSGEMRLCITAPREMPILRSELLKPGDPAYVMAKKAEIEHRFPVEERQRHLEALLSAVGKAG